MMLWALDVFLRWRYFSNALFIYFLFLYVNCNIKSILYAGSEQQKVVISNSHGEKLVGILHETGSRELVVFCHGFQSSKVGISND